MPWDSNHKVPWKRIGMFEGIYLVGVIVVLFIAKPDDIKSSLASLLVAAVVTTAVLILLVKFGYQPNWLRSREEQAAMRAERIAQRAEAKAVKEGKPAPIEQRYRPAPTKRTSTGHTNRQRRTRQTRKR